MTAHSPGPWRFVEGPAYETDRIVAADGSTVVGASTQDYEYPMVDMKEADAKLIAAAPEMLRLLLQVHREGWIGSGMTLDVEVGDLLYALTGGAAGYAPKAP